MGVRGVGLAELQWILLDLPLTLRNLDVRELKTLGNITVGTQTQGTWTEGNLRLQELGPLELKGLKTSGNGCWRLLGLGTRGDSYMNLVEIPAMGLVPQGGFSQIYSAMHTARFVRRWPRGAATMRQGRLRADRRRGRVHACWSKCLSEKHCAVSRKRSPASESGSRESAGKQ